MADASLTYTATDPFSLAGANVHIQSSSADTVKSYGTVADATGNIVCESGAFNETTNYTAEYMLCEGGSMTIGLGNLEGDAVVTGIDASYSNSGATTVSVTGHQHTANAHGGTLRQVNVTITGSNVGVPTITGVTIGGNAVATSATESWSLTHVDKLDADGDQYSGQNFGGLRTVTVEGSGNGSDATTTLVLDSVVDSDSNSDSNTFSLTAHEQLILA